MKIKQLSEKTGWKTIGSEESLQKEVTGVFVGDLLSWVMGNGQSDQAWVTVQGHVNIVAVAVLREFSCIILAQSSQPAQDTLERAKEEGIAILLSDDSAYQCCRTLASFGI